MKRKDPVGDIVPKVRQALKAGRIVVVLGWMAKNHTEATRRLESEAKKHLRFLSSKKKTMPSRAGIFLSTRFVGHECTDEAQKSDVPFFILPVRVIRSVLQECEDLLVPEEKIEVPAQPVQPKPKKTEKVKEEEVTKQKRDTSEVGRRRKLDVSPEECVRFARMFLERVGGDPDGTIGSGSIYTFLSEVFETNDRGDLATYRRRLLDSGWMVGIKSEGASRVGRYKLGAPALEKVTDPESHAVLPEDPSNGENTLEKLQTLIEQEDEVRALIERAQRRLEKIERAKDLLREAEELLS